jgi:hypothetical protein
MNILSLFRDDSYVMAGIRLRRLVTRMARTRDYSGWPSDGALYQRFHDLEASRYDALATRAACPDLPLRLQLRLSPFERVRRAARALPLEGS